MIATRIVVVAMGEMMEGMGVVMMEEMEEMGEMGEMEEMEVMMEGMGVGMTEGMMGEILVTSRLVG